MSFTRAGRDWIAVSARFGPVRITRGAGRAARWYLLTRPWFGEGQVLGDYATRQAAERAAR